MPRYGMSRRRSIRAQSPRAWTAAATTFACAAGSTRVATTTGAGAAKPATSESLRRSQESLAKQRAATSETLRRCQETLAKYAREQEEKVAKERQWIEEVPLELRPRLEAGGGCRAILAQ